MIERLAMDGKYSALETSIHINRHMMAKSYCKGKNILDISCGEGYGSKLLKDWGGKKVVGLDVSEEAILKASNNFKKDGLEYIVHDAMKLDCFLDNTFDMIVSFETIEHLKHPLKFLKELKRVSTDDAVIIISCPNDYLYYPNDNEFNPYHVRKYTFLEFKKMVESVFLKSNIKYMLGSKATGFINYVLDDEKNDVVIQKQMLDVERDIIGVKVSPDQIIDEKKCSYYTAFINISDICENVVVFPDTFVKWVPDLISWDTVKMLEYRTVNEYMGKNVEKINKKIKTLQKDVDVLQAELLEAKALNNQILQSKTYRYSLKVYRLLNKFRWRKKQ